MSSDVGGDKQLGREGSRSGAIHLDISNDTIHLHSQFSSIHLRDFILYPISECIETGPEGVKIAWNPLLYGF